MSLLQSVSNKLTPNITDMTLSCYNTNMPVIRKPNFADITCDQAIENFTVTVGNETNSELKQISLREYLENISIYAKNDKIGSMYLDRDEKILTSAQACVLPLKNGQVEFNVQMYNYQSYQSDDPAILVVMSSAQGTSCQVVHGQTKILFNDNGTAKNMIAKRLTDDRKERGVPLDGPMTIEEKNRNVLFIYQIPLKQKPRQIHTYYNYQSAYVAPQLQTASAVPQQPASGYKYQKTYYDEYDGCCAGVSCCGSMKDGGVKTMKKDKGVKTMKKDKGAIGSTKKSSGMTFKLESVSMSNDNFLDRSTDDFVTETTRGFEKAVLEKGQKVGKFEGTKGLTLERDERYPIRCTFQFYNVTDNSTINEEQIKDIAQTINNIYDKSSASGSLVMSMSDRVTEPTPVTMTYARVPATTFTASSIPAATFM